MAEVLVNENNEVLLEDNEVIFVPEPAKSWFYVTEYDSNGNPTKAKTVGCSGDMPYDYMYGTGGSSKNVLTQNLIKLEINEGVTSITNYAFESCSNLTNVDIPNSVTSIGNGTFFDCSNLTNVTIPNSVTRIGSGAFNRCKSLTNINIPDSVTRIGSGAFSGCKSLTNINIPDSVISIENDAFAYCNNLRSMTIPNRVTSIGSFAFHRCTTLTSMVFGSGITSINSAVFYSCSNCLLFDFRKATKVPTLSNVDAFYGTPTYKKIVVPDALYDSWKSATNWSSTTNNIVTSIIKASDYVGA